MRHLLILAMLILSACGGGMMYPVTSGSHRPGPIPGGRFVVWSNHPGASQAITGLMLGLGQTVVERSRLEQVFAEQHIRLRHTPDSEADVLRVGQLVGATQVIFAEIKGAEEPRGMMEHPTTPSVTVRSVDVQTGAVIWSGSALYTDIPSNRDSAVNNLTVWAIWRAICQTEAGSVWEEPAASGVGGCRPPGQPQQSRRNPSDTTIWRELLVAEHQKLLAEKQVLDEQRAAIRAEKQVLDEQLATIRAEKDAQRQQRMVADYNPKLAAYTQRVEAYERRVKAFTQRGEAFTRSQAEAGRSMR